MNKHLKELRSTVTNTWPALYTPHHLQLGPNSLFAAQAAFQEGGLAVHRRAALLNPLAHSKELVIANDVHSATHYVAPLSVVGRSKMAGPELGSYHLPIHSHCTEIVLCYKLELCQYVTYDHFSYNSIVMAMYDLWLMTLMWERLSIQ